MARQNRVTPFGTLIASPALGTLMGNRGILHNHKQEIFRDWQHKHWITCLLEFKGRRREIMAPGCYTELFFSTRPQHCLRGTVRALSVAPVGTGNF